MYSFTSEAGVQPRGQSPPVVQEGIRVMTMRGGSLVSFALMLACCCSSLSAQRSRPGTMTPVREPSAIGDPAAPADREAELVDQEGLSFAVSIRCRPSGSQVSTPGAEH